MIEVKFYDDADDELLKFAVIISRTNGKWVFCKHRERDTYEVPGGHRESGEDIQEGKYLTVRSDCRITPADTDDSVNKTCISR